MPIPRLPPSPSGALSPPLSPLLIGAEEAVAAAAAVVASEAEAVAVLEEPAPQQQSASQLLEEMDDDMQLDEPVAIHSLPPSPGAAALPAPTASSAFAAPQPSSDAAISAALQPSSDAIADDDALPPASAPVVPLHASAVASDALHPPARTRTRNPSLARHSDLLVMSMSLPVATQSQQHQLPAAHQPLRLSSSIAVAHSAVDGAAGAAFRARLSLPPSSIVHHSAPSSADIPSSQSPSVAAAPPFASLCPPLSSSLGAGLGSSNNSSSSSLPPMSLCESPLPSLPAGCDAAESIVPSQQLLHPPAPSQMPPPSPSLHPSNAHLPSIEDGSDEPQLPGAEDSSPRSPSPSRMGGSPIPTHPPEMDSFEPEQEVDPEVGLDDHADADECRGVLEAEVTLPKQQQQEQREPLNDLTSLQPQSQFCPQAPQPYLAAAAPLADPLGATMEEEFGPASLAAPSLPPLTLHLSLPSDSSNDAAPSATLPSEMEDVRISDSAIAERDAATSAEAPMEPPAVDALAGSALPNTDATVEEPLQPLPLEQPQLPAITAATTPSLYMTEPMQLDEGVAPVATAPSVSLQPASQSDEQPPSPTFDFTPAALPDSASSLLPTLTLPAAVRAPPRSILSSSRRRLPAFCATNNNNKRRVRFNLTEAEAAAHEDEPSSHAAPRKTVARLPKKKSAAAAIAPAPAAREISKAATTSTDAQWRIPPSFELDLSCTLSAASPPLDGHSSTTIAAAAAAAVVSVGSSVVLAAPSLIDLSHSLDGWNTGVGGGGEEDGAASQLFDEPFLEPFMLLDDKSSVANSVAAFSKQECKPTQSTLKQDTDAAAAAGAECNDRPNDVEAVPFASASLQMSASEVQHDAPLPPSLVTAPTSDAARMQLKTEAIAAASSAAPAINAASAAAAEELITLKTERVALKQEATQRMLCDSGRTAVKRERTVKLSTEDTTSNAFVPPIPAAAAAAVQSMNSVASLPRKRPLSPDPSDVAEGGREDGGDAAAAQWLEDNASEAAAAGTTAALDVEAEADLPSDDECMPFAPPVGSPFKSNNKTAGAPTKVSQLVAAKASSKRALPVAPAAVPSSASSVMAGPKAKRARIADKTAAASAATPAVKVDRVRLKQENGTSCSKLKDHSSGKVQASLSSFFTVKPAVAAFGLAGASHSHPPPPPRSATSPAGSFVSSRRTYASAPSEATIASSAAAAGPSLTRKDGRSSAVVERKKIPPSTLAARVRIDLVDDDEHDSDMDLASKLVTGRTNAAVSVLPVAKSSTQAVKARKPRRKLTSAPTPTNKTSKCASAPSDKAGAPGPAASSTLALLPVVAAPAIAAAPVPVAADDSIMMLDLAEDEQSSQIFHYA